jgi:CheY-like chemotaxis protein
VAAILVVDDRAINRQLMVTLLSHYGHEVREAADGSEALMLARSTRPQLVISDILMPTMDGVTFVRALRADPRTAEIPVIFYTATYQVKEAHSLAQSCGVSFVLPKPSSPVDILTAVYSALGLRLPPASIGAPEANSVLNNTPPAAALDKRVADYLADLESVSQLIIGVVDRGRSLAAERDALTGLAGKLRESVDAMHFLALRLGALIEAGLDFAARRDAESLLETSCRAAQNVLVAKYAGMAVWRLSREQRPSFVWRGMERSASAKLGVMPPPSSALGELLRSRTPYRATGRAADRRRVGLGEDHPAFASILAVPLQSAVVDGYLYVADRIGANAFTDDDERLALTVAAQAVRAYENLVLLGAPVA